MNRWLLTALLCLAPALVEAIGITGTSSTWINTPNFSTRRSDETGLIYMGARYYDPVTGRFLSADPARFMTL